MARRSNPRLRSATSMLIGLAVVASSTPAIRAADDVTAPVGTLRIGNGSAYTSAPTVTLHVAATDDVAVTEVRVSRGDGMWTSYPYDPTVEWTFEDPAVPGSGLDGEKSLWVQWFDGAGNASEQRNAVVFLDTTTPNLEDVQFPDAIDAEVDVYVNAWDETGVVTHVQFSSNNGTTWGAPLPYDSGRASVTWHPFSSTEGGSSRLGARTVRVRVVDGAGNVSASLSRSLFVSVGRIPINVSPAPTTGHPITLTPGFPAGATFPSGTVCQWEIAWGNDEALYEAKHDETYGTIFISGPSSQGYCGPWTFTLPWVPVRKFIVLFDAYVVDQDHTLAWGSRGTKGPTDTTAITAAVGGTSRHITQSNLPLVYVLPDSFRLVVGVPATYRAYTVGGGTLKSNDQWLAAIEPDRSITKSGGSTFTFTPTEPRNVLVCWSAPYRTYIQSACYDPPARYPDSTAPVVTTGPLPTVKLGGVVATTIPALITWAGSDRGWGIARYQVQESRNGGSWVSRSLATPAATSLARNLTPTGTYRYRVRAIDKAGNVGAWRYGSTFSPRLISDASTAISWTSNWTVGSQPGALGGSDHRATASTAGAYLRFTGQAIAWIARRGPGMGSARVYVDGSLAATVSLASSTSTGPIVVFQRRWATSGAHTIQIRPVGNGPVVVDGFARL